ncbi:lipoprotein-releasing ABC transporter permease subunit [Rickettsia endosymbiont of Culicoides newsteadi]|uniref:lipoprotein-releasing ABC transporter permease subunit n=1 Tax=Rickettsia endosymbiont of Culicoides newsteadi TaxID=1961830 RepID=UPI000B9C65B1|nr:lipoprotein-releasing ABC transporter permease subunit [Rickettsia endosymbiont of Culicoides newsteadi]MDN3031315.1 lipoprotein-releasing ABC transporter permease subunit [Candidatus Tisiphia sp.]OZG31551.1 multidrug ABC transporter substrate-binding protein [Rickettsia endosymbiont of Culicoides newsteadi]
MIKNNFILKVAARYFRAKKNEKFVSIISGFSLIGVTIGVAALIVVMSVMNGFHYELTKNIIGLNGDISITPLSRFIANYDEINKKLLSKNYIKHISPSVVGQALALGNRANSGAVIKGIDLSELKYKNQILQNVNTGDFADFSGKDVVAIGNELAYNLGIQAGDKIKLISPNSISTAFGSMPRSKEFMVVATFTSGAYDYDAATILMPLIAAQNFLSFGEVINLIEVITIEPSNAGIYAWEIQNILGSKLRVISWQKSHLQFLNALAVERVAMFTILSLIIMVAAFNIVSSLFMLVKDKTSDIAVLRTIGASTRQIMLIFICNGMFIGVPGTVLGIILGTSFAYNIQSIKNILEKITGTKIFEAAIYYLYSLPSKVKMEDITLVASISIVLCFCATIYPAYKAAKLNPVDALRYE